ncbi:hypothetical protein MRB53_007681 [Persea americana]|uniref:Uncharacterized protein n=1 Tax=Persea americana TaxID=3435 RepID=A0ACC2MK92_PERAE|nr:hypothetical protein MRB53_007681 [Persea americana]
MKFGGPIKNDQTFKDVQRLLGCKGSGRGRAMIGHGSDHMVAWNGETIMEWLVQLKKDEKIPMTIQSFFSKLIGFIPAPPKIMRCNHIYVTSTNGIIQENMVCVHCGCLMEKKVMFSCCKNE